MWKEHLGIREIAREIGRSASTVSRELVRNISFHSRDWHYPIYRPVSADKKYLERIHKRRTGKYDKAELAEYVRSRLLRTWSPEQIAGRIRLEYPKDRCMRVSHSTIYRWLHHDLLSPAAAIRLRHAGHKHGETRGKFVGVRTIRQRCKEAYRRKRLGDWELDTVVSSSRQDQDGLLSMCDRKSRYCVIALLHRVKSNKVIYQALATVSDTMPCLTFTADRGTEFGCFKKIEAELNIPIYFCNPGSPWQKGSVENLNGLIREFFPKGTNFGDISESEAQRAMDILNNRPRKCLKWATPAEVFACSSF